MTKKYEVTIDLFKSNLPGSIDNSAFVQQALKDRLIQDIDNAVREYETELEYRNSETESKGIISEAGRQLFFIDGTRGAGKTTFMNDIVRHFMKSKQIHALRCIDPTKLPQVEPILVTVIAQLNSDVTRAIKSTSGWESGFNAKKEEWQNCLKSISKAIQLLDKKEYSKDFFDESLELNALLTNASDGLGLGKVRTSS